MQCNTKLNTTIFILENQDKNIHVFCHIQAHTLERWSSHTNKKWFSVWAEWYSRYLSKEINFLALIVVLLCVVYMDKINCLNHSHKLSIRRESYREYGIFQILNNFEAFYPKFSVLLPCTIESMPRYSLNIVSSSSFFDRRLNCRLVRPTIFPAFAIRASTVLFDRVYKIGWQATVFRNSQD